jgi:hypothetical protein
MRALGEYVSFTNDKVEIRAVSVQIYSNFFMFAAALLLHYCWFNCCCAAALLLCCCFTAALHASSQDLTAALLCSLHTRRMHKRRMQCCRNFFA